MFFTWAEKQKGEMPQTYFSNALGFLRSLSTGLDCCLTRGTVTTDCDISDGRVKMFQFLEKEKFGKRDEACSVASKADTTFLLYFCVHLCFRPWCC